MVKREVNREVPTVRFSFWFQDVPCRQTQTTGPMSLLDLEEKGTLWEQNHRRGISAICFQRGDTAFGLVGVSSLVERINIWTRPDGELVVKGNNFRNRSLGRIDSQGMEGSYPVIDDQGEEVLEENDIVGTFNGPLFADPVVRIIVAEDGGPKEIPVVVLGINIRQRELVLHKVVPSTQDWVTGSLGSHIVVAALAA